MVLQSSRSLLFYKIVVLKNFAEVATWPPFYEKRCCQKFCKIQLQIDSIYSIQFVTLLKKRLWHRYFPVNSAKILRTPFLKNICEQLLLTIWKLLSKTYMVEPFQSTLLVPPEIFPKSCLEQLLGSETVGDYFYKKERHD